MLGLGGGGGGRASAQLLAGRLTGPRARIDLTNDTQPFFSFGERREVPHVQSEALAALLEAAADEKREAFELGQIGLGQRHRSGGRAQIQYERARVRGCRRWVPGLGACNSARCQLWRWWCHMFPRTDPSFSHGLSGQGSDRKGVRAFARCARSWQPRRHRNPLL
jgi:hypothetical protein